MEDTKIAWAAGFFDGEGCIYQIKNTAYVYVSQKEDWVLEHFKSIVEYGKIYHYKRKTPGGSITSVTQYYVGGSKAILVLKLLLPYLIFKREKALNAINLRNSMKRGAYAQGGVYLEHLV